MIKVIIGFSHSKSPFAIGSKIIASAENRSYSHVHVQLSDSEIGREMVYQASNGFVNCLTLEAFTQIHEIVKEYILMATDSEYWDMIIFLKSSLGAPYSRAQMIAIAIKKLLGVQLNISNKDSAFICSELGARVCQCLKIPVNESVDFVTPSDLDKILSDNKIQVRN